MTVSKQVAYQQRKLKDGLCSICGQYPLVTAIRCKQCAEKDREAARARTGSKPWQEGRPGRPPKV